MQSEAETKRTLSIPNHVLPLEAKDAIMRQKYTATMKPVSAAPFKNDFAFSFVATSFCFTVSRGR